MTEIARAKGPSPVARPTLSEAEAAELEQLFRALADRTRLRILDLLADADDAVCVCNLEPVLGLAQPTVSYHLKLLVDAGLLERERRGRFGFYRIPAGASERVCVLVRERVASQRSAA
jgi:ArsR family transcriptional regulator